MKIKKEDVGLYFALGLAGAATGLLVGAYVASRQEGPGSEEDPVPFGPAPLRGKARLKGEPAPGFSKPYEKKSRKKKWAKKDVDVVELQPELDSFIIEYEPTAMQIEMVKKGVVDVEELKEIILQERLDTVKEPYNYADPYVDDKPDLSELVEKIPEEEPPIDERYELLQDPPKNKSKKSMRVVYFDSEDGSFYTMTRQKRPVPLVSIEEFIPQEAWDIALPYMVSGFAPLYVNDLKTAKHYRLELVPEDEEESSEDNETNR